MPQRFLLRFWAAHGWEVVYTAERPARPAQVFPTGGLPLSDPTRRYLTACYPEGLYQHQIEAISAALQGNDVALTTGTASGKSVSFYACAIEAIARNPCARVLAVYPLKALAREQEQRWAAALNAAGLPGDDVMRLDGDVPTAQRFSLLREASVLVSTPDILHAWLLPNAGDSAVWNFIRCLALVVVDEVHVYTGVFGSNAAFLFRRLEHLMALAGQRPSYIVASATIREPDAHLRALFGREFSLITDASDSSGQQPVTIYMVRPPDNKDILSSVSALSRGLARETESRFITFLDSRKQTELVATIIARSQQKDGDGGEDDEGGDPIPGLDHLNKLDVLPYRAGFEEQDRSAIQDRLTRGKLRGVISTSALELGIDIPSLDVGILVGVPRSKTSLQQRIGRVGRQSPGVVVILNNGDLYSEAMFREPAKILERPLAEGALYLENPRIQYIHAMCLARPGGEHDAACARVGRSGDEAFESTVKWPPGFVELCERERSGEVPADLQSMKMEAGDVPHHTYPLRDVESQLTVEFRQGPQRMPLGSLSYSQLLREAYPGAVYYYTTIPYRVYQVLLRSRTVLVRRERYYTTRPLCRPSQVFPNLSPGNIYRAIRCGELLLVEANLQIRETVCGYKERRGSTEIAQQYPLDAAKTGIKFSQQFFTRNYFTTGVIITHPALSSAGITQDALAQWVYECFLMEIPFERQDINWATGKLKVTRGPLTEGTRFIAIYDQTYGSLRLSGRLLDPGVAAEIFTKAAELAREGMLLEGLSKEAVSCLGELASSVQIGHIEDLADLAAREVAAEAERVAEEGTGERVRIILPGSVGLDRLNGNEEFHVEGVFYSPRDGKLRYRGRHESDLDPTVKVTVPVENINPVPGESRLGWYDMATGEISEE